MCCMQDDWIVSKSSKFSYHSFVGSQTKKLRHKARMVCRIKLCATENLSSCRVELNESDDRYQRYDESYQFTAHGIK